MSGTIPSTEILKDLLSVRTLPNYSLIDLKACTVLSTHWALYSTWVLNLVANSSPLTLSYCSTLKSRFSNRVSSRRLTFFIYWSFSLRIEIGMSLNFSRLTSSYSANFLKTSWSATETAFSIVSPNLSFWSKAVSVISIGRIYSIFSLSY